MVQVQGKTICCLNLLHSTNIDEIHNNLSLCITIRAYMQPILIGEANTINHIDKYSNVGIHRKLYYVYNVLCFVGLLFQSKILLLKK